mmetsp:Transcript_77184/g.198770  ORF Transcript_77184/g.198770 Transcript_77184/m.198770 type:complete len:172 (-) Transcript_77184:71-586(-)
MWAGASCHLELLALLATVGGALEVRAPDSEPPTKLHVAFLTTETSQETTFAKVVHNGQEYGHAAAVKAAEATRFVAGKAASFAQAYVGNTAAGAAATKDLLGTTLQIAIVVLLVLVALFFYWGGNTHELEDDPKSSLMETAQRAAATLAEQQVENPFATQPSTRRKNACVC